MPMFALPIAAREARETARRARTYHARWIVGLFGLLAIPFAFWMAQYDDNKGDAVFSWLSIVAQLYALFAGVIAASDAISSERREETLGLLFLTDLRPSHILAGKLLASSTTAFFGLFALLPFLAVPALLGGVSGERFLLVALQLLNTLFVSVSWGLLASSVFRQGWAALTAGIIAMAALGIAIPWMAVWFDPVIDFLIFVSPSAGLFPLLDEPVTGYRDFGQALFFNHLAAWANLSIVSLRLVYLWRDRPPNEQQQRRLDRQRSWRFGNRHARHRLRKRLLDQNPLAWLANRDQISSFGLIAFFFMLFFGILAYSWLFTARGELDRIVWGAIWAIGLAHFALFFRICIASAYSIAEDRKSGALELLLSTPLSVNDILKGRWHGLMRQFFGPAAITELAHLVFLVFAIFSLEPGLRATFPGNIAELPYNDEQIAVGWVAISALILPLNWLAAGWLGAWLGLRCKSSATAVWLTFAIVLAAPWLFLGLIVLLIEMAGIRDLVMDQYWVSSLILLAGCALGLLHAGAVMNISRRRLSRYFRLAAGDRFHIQRLPFPWRFVRAAGAIFALIITFAALWLHQVNERGRQVWAKALSGHPDFDPKFRVVERFPQIPDSENFAAHPLLKKLSSAPRFIPRIRRGRLPDDPVLALRYPFVSANYPAAWIRPPNEIEEHWTRGKLLNLEEYESYALQNGQITNRAASPAYSVLKALEKYEAIFDELRAAAERLPRAYFPQFNEHLTHVCLIASSHAVARLRIGEPALADVRLILRIAQGTRHLPQRELFLQHAYQPIFEGLVQRRWSDSDLRILEAEMAALDGWSRQSAQMESTLRGAIRGIDEHLQTLRQSHNLYQVAIGIFYPEGWALELKAFYLRLLFEDFPRVFDADRRFIDPIGAIALNNLAEPSSLLRSPISGLLYSAHQFARQQTLLDQARIACALERYRLRHGRLPDHLTELSPEFIDPLPMDIMTGQPLIYHPTQDRQGCTLYSIGWDGRDDGGRKFGELVRIDPHEKGTDWIWPASVRTQEN